MFRVLLGGLIGALIAFLWSFVSWSLLPWHEATMHQFCDQEYVQKVIKENSPKSGVYLAPFPNCDQLEKEGATSGVEAHYAALKKGPLIYAQVDLEGMDPSQPSIYLYSLLTQFLGATLICALLRQASQLSYGGRLLFVTANGLIVGILGFLPAWNWFGAGAMYTLVMIADVVVTWFLAGLFIAALFKKKRTLIEI